MAKPFGHKLLVVGQPKLVKLLHGRAPVVQEGVAARTESVVKSQAVVVGFPVVIILFTGALARDKRGRKAKISPSPGRSCA